MLGFKYFIFSFFLWLSFSYPQDFNGDVSIFDSKAEITTSSDGTNNLDLIVDRNIKTNWSNWSFKTFKIPYIPINHRVSLPTAGTYDYKLLYLEIGKTIPLKLTSSKLIFPFHCFT